MKSCIILALCVAVALAIPLEPRDATIVRYENNNIGVGGYNYASETSDGKFAQEEGQLKNEGTENEALVVRGQYSYPGPDGVVYTVTYTADEEGFKPIGVHIPQSA